MAKSYITLRTLRTLRTMKPVQVILPLLLIGLALLFSLRSVNLAIKTTGSSGLAPLNGKVIAIDAGHGGDDPGVWDQENDIKEKDINLALALQLRDMLVKEGATVILTRERDLDYILPRSLRGSKTRKQSDLDQRIEIVKKAKADVLVSIHVNATTKKSYGGAEAFYHPESTSGRVLAESIQHEIRLIPGMIKRIPKTGNYYLLHHSAMPAVIVELGFMTYAPEREKLITASYQQQLCQAITQGIASFCLEDTESNQCIPEKGSTEQLMAENNANQNGATIYFKPLLNTSALLQGNKLDIKPATSSTDLSMAESVLEQLLHGPQSNTPHTTPFPPGSALKSLEVVDGIATVDLNQAISNIAGSQEEKAAVYSIVGSLLSLPAIKGVKLLVEGKPVKTLAGHIDTWHTYTQLTGVYQDSDATLWEGNSPRVAIVIDDLGASIPSETRKLLALNIPLTLGVLPGSPVASKISREAINRGYEVILHLPMESHLQKPEMLGQDPILTELSEPEIERRFREHLQRVPGAVGFNNHMGSKASEDRRVIKIVLQIAAQSGLFVLDSRTTLKTVIPELAAELGVPYAARTLFLDGPENTGQVERQLRQLAEEAKSNGIAVGIGHVGAESRQTAIVLEKAAAIMKAAGVELVFLSEVIK